MEAKKVKSDWLVIGRAVTAHGNIKNIQNLIERIKIMKIKICGLNQLEMFNYVLILKLTI